MSSPPRNSLAEASSLKILETCGFGFICSSSFLETSEQRGFESFSSAWEAPWGVGTELLRPPQGTRVNGNVRFPSRSRTSATAWARAGILCDSRPQKQPKQYIPKFLVVRTENLKAPHGSRTGRPLCLSVLQSPLPHSPLFPQGLHASVSTQIQSAPRRCCSRSFHQLLASLRVLGPQ